MPSSERRRQYRVALVTARNLGLDDAELAEIIQALGPNAPLDDLEAAIFHTAFEPFESATGGRHRNPDAARAWGFRPVGEVIWGLRNAGMGAPPLVNDHEPVLLAVRGSQPFLGEQPMGVYFWKQPYVNGGKAHSAKPEAFLDRVELWSPGPYVECFARRARFGWDYFGDQSLDTAAMPGSVVTLDSGDGVAPNKEAA